MATFLKLYIYICIYIAYVRKLNDYLSLRKRVRSIDNKTGKAVTPFLFTHIAVYVVGLVYAQHYSILRTL